MANEKRQPVNTVAIDRANNRVTIVLPLVEQPSKTGKMKSVATTNGFSTLADVDGNLALTGNIFVGVRL